MALRIAVLGVVAIVIFCALFFRLWALQVISGEQYLEDAKNNQIRTFRLAAPRGSIVDRDGDVLVSNMPGTLVQIWPAALEDVSAARRDALLRRLSRLLGVRPRKVHAKVVGGLENDPLTPITIRADVGELKTAYLMEHQSEFPGVQITETYLRHYDQGTIGAQILGYVGEISARAAQEQGGGRLRGRGPDRADRHRGRLRLVPPRRARRRAGLRRRDGAGDEPARVQPDARGGRQHPPDDRLRPPAHRRGRARVRHPPGARAGRMGGRRRRDSWR